MSTIVAEKEILNNQKQDLYLYVSEFLHKNVGLELTRSRFQLLEKEINTILDIALDFNPRFSLTNSQLEDLIHIFSNHETSFYRHTEHFVILYNEIFPAFFGDNPDKPIRIWSAACSYGQEVYSLAILLEEFLDKELYLRARKLINTENIQSKHRNISITGTDISKSVIEFAQNGVYSLKELDRNLSKEYRILLDNYCLIKQDRLHISSLIKSQVEFKVYNLLQSNFHDKFDIIFCRNVLIYFKPEIQSRVIQKLVQNLNAGGYIFIGPSETIFEMENELETIHSGHCVFYRKLGT